MLDLSQNYFELFGLPERYAIDPAQLTERYRDLQRRLHPDRYAQASDQERRLAMQGATRVNEAHRTLKSPLARALYLLELRGLPAEPGSASMSPAFLMEQMELREALAEARHQDNPYAALSTLKQDVERRIGACVGAVGGLLAGDDPAQLDPAREAVNELRFLEKLRSEVDNLEALLDEEL